MQHKVHLHELRDQNKKAGHSDCNCTVVPGKDDVDSEDDENTPIYLDRD